MRKLAFAGALAAAALFAQGARAEDAAEKAAGETKKSATRVEQAGDRAVHGSGPASQQGGSRGSMDQAADRQASAGQQHEKKHPLFEGKNNFDVDGKIQKVSKNSITIQRDELPAAELTVSRNTKIELDGDQASMAQLRQGQDVKASFNLNKDKAEAVEIKAEKQK